jgi:hypothetical protein
MGAVIRSSRRLNIVDGCPCMVHKEQRCCHEGVGIVLCNWLGKGMPKQVKGLREVDDGGSVVSRLVRKKVGEVRRRDEENCVREEVVLARTLDRAVELVGSRKRLDLLGRTDTSPRCARGSYRIRESPQ